MAGAAVGASRVFAGNSGRVAVVSLKSLLAQARVSLPPVPACSPILAGIMGATSIQLDFAIGASEARSTTASIGALTGVEAEAAVLTRLVVGTVVEVLVAEQTSPSLVTKAVPLLLTCAVQATRVSFAFVAVSTLPTATTTVTKESIIIK